MRRFATRLLTSLAATLVALALVAAGIEVWTRLRWNEHKGTPGFFLSDPSRIQRLAPGYRGWFGGVPVRINDLGFRDDREYALEKSPHTFRILVLGDSVTFGDGSVYEHTYPYLLEQKLKRWRPDIDWQVWNAGVPGYNTSQELAYLLDEGPRFKPDLVVVGFFENDFVGNYAVNPSGLLARARSFALSFLYRHVYSTELYKRIYLQLAWKISGENSYRQRLVHVASEEQLIAKLTQVQDLEAQKLTPYETFSDEDVASIACPNATPLDANILQSIQREAGWSEWVAAVRRFQQLDRDRVYSVLFFASVVPLECDRPDAFFDGGSAALNRFYMSYLGDGTPAVSVYDAFRRVRPSQMPFASGHAMGNANALKADVLFEYLRDHAAVPAPRPR